MANYGEEVVSAIMERFGIEPDYRGEGWAWTLCPLHEDRKPSFTIHLQEGGWKCVAGCGSSPDLAVLVQRLEGGNLRDIQTHLRNMFIDDKNILRRALVPSVPEKEERFPEPLFYERGKIYPYILKRGFSREILREWNVGIDSQLEAVVVPITEEGKLVGLYRRLIKGKGFMNSGGFDKSHTLFGLDHIPDDADTVIAVEGALDALWLFQHGYHAVATLGGGLTPIQAQRLIRRFRRIILGFDNDKFGRKFEEEAVQLMKGKVVLSFLRLPAGKKDVQECNASELENSLANIKEIMI